MIVLLGASGYVGSAFRQALEARSEPYLALSRETVDYTDFEILVRLLQDRRPSFLINAAGYTGKPNVDACETARADTIAGNVLLPATISHACAETGTPWGHVSSGCIYQGGIVAGKITRDLSSRDLQLQLATSPELLEGFRESDESNFSFRRPPCSFYSGCKALAEEMLAADRQVYLWRLRIPFNEIAHARNYLQKLQTYAKVYDNINSLSHLNDFVRACLELWERRAPFGAYNVTNPGYVSTRQVIDMIKNLLRPSREFIFWEDDAAFYREAAQAPRSNCVLNSEKLVAAGVQLRNVQSALVDALTNWTTMAEHHGGQTRA